MATLRFSIRDDDTCFFTCPEQLRRAYDGIWERVPVSLSIVPFQGRTQTKAIPPEYRSGGDELYPVSENRELVGFLREQLVLKRVSVMLHGYSHVDLLDGHEFETGSDLDQKAREGKRFLEEVFGTPVYAFVPSHNALSARGYRAVTTAGLDIVQIVRFRGGRRPFTPRHLPQLARLAWARAVWKHRYPYVLDFGTHREVAAYSLTPSVSAERLLKELEFCAARRGVFVLATHHWELFETTKDGLMLRSALERLVRRAHELGAEFCSVNHVLGRG